MLVSQDVLRVVAQGLVELDKFTHTENNWELSILCAKCIAQIGLCHSFVIQPTLLRANNQEAIAIQSLGSEETKDQSGVPNVTKSDYYNPVINMKYRQTQHDSTLEFLAFPHLKNLPIERHDFV